MDSYVTKLQEIELIAGDSGIVLEFQVFYEDGRTLDLRDDTAKWYLSPIGMKHSPVLEKDCTILRDSDSHNPKNQDGLYYRFIVHLEQNDTKNFYGKYVQQPILIDRQGRIFRRAEGFINFKPQISVS